MIWSERCNIEPVRMSAILAFKVVGLELNKGFAVACLIAFSARKPPFQVGIILGGCKCFPIHDIYAEIQA